MGGLIVRRRVGLVAVAGALLGTSLVGSSAAAAPVPCRKEAVQQLRGAALESIRLRTFHIEAEPQEDSYRIGEKALLDIIVTRPAHEDPADLGVELTPPASAPAEGVTVGVGVHVGQVFVPGFGITDAEGKTTISIKLPGYMKPGPASVTVYAWHVIHESPCLRIEEDGFASYPEAFEVTR